MEPINSNQKANSRFKHHIRFNHETHRRFYFQMLKRAGDKRNRAVRALFYVLGIGKETRNHIDDLYDFKQKTIRSDAIFKHWQTDQSVRATILAFHLWNGYSSTLYDYLLTPQNLLGGSFGPFYMEALKLRYPDVFPNAL